MATESQRQRLRLDLGLAADDTTSLPDTTIDDIFSEVEEEYTDAGSIKAATRVLAIQRLRAQAASSVDYTQNNTTEKASQRFSHLGQLLVEWQARLDEATAATRSTVRFGRTTRRPARIKEYPGF